MGTQLNEVRDFKSAIPENDEKQIQQENVYYDLQMREGTLKRRLGYMRLTVVVLFGVLVLSALFQSENGEIKGVNVNQVSLRTQEVFLQFGEQVQQYVQMIKEKATQPVQENQGE